MKTIYLKAKVVDNRSVEFTGIKIGEFDFTFYIPPKDLKQAQVLAVEEMLKYLNSNKNKHKTFTMEFDGSNGLWEVIPYEGKGVINNNLSELTSLVRGKERTLEDVVRDILNHESWKSGNQVQMVSRELLQEAEQLLKNRE